MLGFVVGTVSLLALLKLLRHRRGWHHGHRGGCGYHHRRHHHGCGGRGFDRGFDRGGFDGFDGGFDDDNRGGPVFLRGLFTRLETTPGQERVILESLKELKGAFQKAKQAARKSARDLGDAMTGDSLSADAMGEVFAALDEGTDAIRSASMSALSKIHEVLDARQRRILADLLGRGGGLEDLANNV